MAISANSVFEIRTAGSDVAGGGFVTGASGTDFSQQDAKNTVGNNISTTDATCSGSTTLTSATASFTSAIVGNIIYLAGGSGTIAAQWRQVTAFTNATTVTIDAVIGASSGMTMNIGGALASPGQAGAMMIAGNMAWVKTGTYNITSTTSNVSGGKVTINDQVLFRGYNASRGDDGTPPTLTASGIATTVLVTVSGLTGVAWNLKADGASLTSIQGFLVSNSLAFAAKCLAVNCTNSGFSMSQPGELLLCRATTCATQPAFLIASSGGIAFGCVSHANSVIGFSATGGQSSVIDCLSYGNTGAGSHGFSLMRGAYMNNCSAYGNGGAGFSNDSAPQRIRIANCISEGNTTYGFALAGTGAWSVVLNCATYNNTSGSSDNAPSIGTITALSGSPFTNAGSGDFSLNNTAGAGAACRAAGLPGVFPGGLTTAYLDIGAAQHLDSGGGTTTNIFVSRRQMLTRPSYYRPVRRLVMSTAGTTINNVFVTRRPLYFAPRVVVKSIRPLISITAAALPTPLIVRRRLVVNKPIHQVVRRPSAALTQVNQQIVIRRRQMVM